MATRRGPGRPRLDEVGPSVQVNLRLGPRLYDAIYTQARKDRCNTVTAWIRKALVTTLTRRGDQDENES